MTGEAAHASIKGPATWDVKNFVSAVQSLVSTLAHIALGYCYLISRSHVCIHMYCTPKHNVVGVWGGGGGGGGGNGCSM